MIPSQKEKDACSAAVLALWFAYDSLTGIPEEKAAASSSRCNTSRRRIETLSQVSGYMRNQLRNTFQQHNVLI
jgi:hypothetical protein